MHLQCMILRDRAEPSLWLPISRNHFLEIASQTKKNKTKLFFHRQTGASPWLIRQRGEVDHWPTNWYPDREFHWPDNRKWLNVLGWRSTSSYTSTRPSLEALKRCTSSSNEDESLRVGISYLELPLRTSSSMFPPDCEQCICRHRHPLFWISESTTEQHSSTFPSNRPKKTIHEVVVCLPTIGCWDLLPLSAVHSIAKWSKELLLNSCMKQKLRIVTILLESALKRPDSRDWTVH